MLGQASHLQPPGKGEIRISQQADPNSTTCLLTVSVFKPGWIIKSVVIYNEALFEGDSFVSYPSQSTSQLQIPLKCEKNQEQVLDLRVMVGTGIHSSQFFIHHEPRYILRRFSMFKFIGSE